MVRLQDRRRKRSRPQPRRSLDALVSVDGKALPADVNHGGRTVTVKAGMFTIHSDGTCRSQTTFSVPPRTDVNRDVNATYTLNGANLTMKWEGAGTSTSKVSGDTFTMHNEGMVFTYRKQPEGIPAINSSPTPTPPQNPQSL